jgi:S1-C subfamily serine protease
MRRVAPLALVFGVGVVTTLAAVSALHGANVAGFGSPGSQLVLTRLETPVPETPAASRPNIYSKPAAEVSKSIVSIYTESKPIAVDNGIDADPFFRRFFGDQLGGQQQTERERGVGSGVIISEDGYILTNNHVVQNAATVKVDLPDGKALTAKVVGADPTSDIAVVKIDPAGENLVAAKLGNSKDLQVGDMVIAAGDPLDIGTTVTSGIISALGHRNTDAMGSRQMAPDIIQTDAAINPGNSGGALADLDGNVIGINEAIISPTGSFVGIGLAIPINTARTIAEQLIKDGKVVRPYIGIAYVPLKGVDVQSRKQLGIALTDDNGVVVTNVYPDSPAAKAGLKNYDVILDANGQPLTDDNLLQPAIQKLQVGDTLVLRVARGNERPLISIKVAEMPADFGQQPADTGEGGDQGNQGDQGDQGGNP